MDLTLGGEAFVAVLRRAAVFLRTLINVHSSPRYIRSMSLDRRIPPSSQGRSLSFIVKYPADTLELMCPRPASRRGSCCHIHPNTLRGYLKLPGDTLYIAPHVRMYLWNLRPRWRDGLGQRGVWCF